MQIEEEVKKIDERRAAIEKRLKEIQAVKQQHASAKRKVESKIKKLEQSINKCDCDSCPLCSGALQAQRRGVSMVGLLEYSSVIPRGVQGHVAIKGCCCNFEPGPYTTPAPGAEALHRSCLNASEICSG